jgi:hypothetical protein
MCNSIHKIFLGIFCYEKSTWNAQWLENLEQKFEGEGRDKTEGHKEIDIIERMKKFVPLDVVCSCVGVLCCLWSSPSPMCFGLHVPSRGWDAHKDAKDKHMHTGKKR